MPQENGNRAGVRWAELTDGAGAGLRVEGRPHVELTARRWTSEDLDAARHAADLVAARPGVAQRRPRPSTASAAAPAARRAPAAPPRGAPGGVRVRAAPAWRIGAPSVIMSAWASKPWWGARTSSGRSGRCSAAAGDRGGALLVRGEPGIGKSTLLAAARREAAERGLRVLAAAGVQSESDLPFAGLHQLVRPVLGHIAALAPAQQEALLAAFGMGSAPAPDRLLIALAALDLLSEAAAEAPPCSRSSRTRTGSTTRAPTCSRSPRAGWSPIRSRWSSRCATGPTPARGGGAAGARARAARRSRRRGAARRPRAAARRHPARPDPARGRWQPARARRAAGRDRAPRATACSRPPTCRSPTGSSTPSRRAPPSCRSRPARCC